METTGTGVATGLARSLAAVLTGRVGAVRGVIHAYFIPVLAVIFGVVLLGEQLTLLELIGLPVAPAGGYLVTLGSVPGVPTLAGSLGRGLQAAHRLRKGTLAS